MSPISARSVSASTGPIPIRSSSAPRSDRPRPALAPPRRPRAHRRGPPDTAAQAPQLARRLGRQAATCSSQASAARRVQRVPGGSPRIPAQQQRANHLRQPRAHPHQLMPAPTDLAQRANRRRRNVDAHDAAPAAAHPRAAAHPADPSSPRSPLSVSSSADRRHTPPRPSAATRVDKGPRRAHSLRPPSHLPPRATRDEPRDAVRRPRKPPLPQPLARRRIAHA